MHATLITKHEKRLKTLSIVVAKIIDNRAFRATATHVRNEIQ